MVQVPSTKYQVPSTVLLVLRRFFIVVKGQDRTAKAITANTAWRSRRPSSVIHSNWKLETGTSNPYSSCSPSPSPRRQLVFGVVLVVVVVVWLFGGCCDVVSAALVPLYFISGHLLGVRGMRNF
jgi:hypothetical protein